MALVLNRGQKLCSFGLAPICFGSRTGAEYDKQPLPKALPALVNVSPGGSSHRNPETPKCTSHLTDMHSPPGSFWNFPGTQQFMEKQIIFIQFTLHTNNEKNSLNLEFLSLKYRVSFDSPPFLQ